MSWKIDIRQIVKDHLSTLKNDRLNRADKSRRLGVSDVVSFILFPVVMGILLPWMEVLISKDFLPTLISSLSIFIGLMLNSMVILLNLLKNNGEGFRNIKLDVLRETLANISFTILLSIACILILFSTQIKSDLTWIPALINGIAYFFLALFLATLLMVVKRIYLLFSNEVEEQKRRKGHARTN